MAVTGTRTARQIIAQAMRRAGVLDIAESANTDEEALALESLDLMLKSWQNMGYNLWTKTSLSHTLTAAANQTLTPVRPLRILSCRFKEAATSNELPMMEMTREEYDMLPNKTTTGIPTQFHYDRQRESAVLYVWPIIETAVAQTLQITYERELEDYADATDTLDMPGEWWEAVVNNLAIRLCADFDVSVPAVLPTLARESLQMAGAFDREESFYFGDSSDY